MKNTMKYNILNFATIEENELKTISTYGNITHVGVAAGELKNPSEDTVLQILKEQDPDILIINSLPFNKTCIDQLSNKTKLIICARGNPLNVDVAYCHEKGIMLTATPGRNANGVVEFTLLIMLVFNRKLISAINAIQNKECTLDKDPSEINPNAKDIIWMHKDLPYFPYNEFNGREIATQTLGLIGFGFIGQILARKAHSLGMNILVFDPYISQDILDTFPVKSVSLNTLLMQSDIVSLHAKANEQTYHMINNKTLSFMKPTALLINTARSTLVDTTALLDALKNKKIAGAALDVFDYEPLSNKDALIINKLDNLLITPHIGGATKEVANHQSRMIRESLEAFINGTEIPYQAK